MLTDEDLEIMSHILPEELRYTDEEVIETSFMIINQSLGGIDILSKEHQEVLTENLNRIIYNVLLFTDDKYNGMFFGGQGEGSAN